MVTCFGSVPFLPSAVRDLPEFAYLMFLDRSNLALDVCFGMVGCLVLVVLVIRTLFSLSLFGDLASFHLERCLGAYPVDFGGAWTPPDYGDAADIALEMLDHPDVWTDGSREDFSSIGGFQVAGAVVYLPAS